MKRIVMIAIIVFLFLGCIGPRFKSEAQYNKGEWKGNAYLNEVAQIQRDKAQLAFDKAVGEMALKKIESQDDAIVVNGVKQYEGIVQNFNNYITQIIIRSDNGYEVASYVLGPKNSLSDRTIDYRLPGDYCAVFIVNGIRQKEVKRFTVGPRKFDYFGKKYHWYAYQPE